MSIYPVKLADWFPKGDEDNHYAMVSMVKCSKCVDCGKKNLRWQQAIGSHSLPWGYGDVWCGVRCFKKHKKYDPRKE